MSEERTAPVQGWGERIPWWLHLKCYEGYCKEFGPQKSLVEGECRGGFGVNELDRWVPGWRDELSGRTALLRELAAARSLIEDALRVMSCDPDGDIDWPNIRETLMSYAAAFDPEGLRQEAESLKSWVSDLQSGMYVNCVYCGHRYGPKETTPVTMADALKAHIEECPKHPLSILKATNELMRTDLAAARAENERLKEIGDSLRDEVKRIGESAPECNDCRYRGYVCRCVSDPINSAIEEYEQARAALKEGKS